MNFFKFIQSSKSYFSIFKKIRIDNDKHFLLSNFGLLVGNQSLFKLLTIYELIKEIRYVKGDIIEFGVWNGNNLILIKKLTDYLNLNKNIFGYDWFKGLKKFSKFDKKINNKKYIGKKKRILDVIRFFNLKKINLVDDDVANFSYHFKSSKKFCLIYLDLDLYEPTMSLLNIIDKNLEKNGLIVFDQANKNQWPGENKAMKTFYLKNKNKYKQIKLDKNFSPDIILKKIKK